MVQLYKAHYYGTVRWTGTTTEIPSSQSGATFEIVDNNVEGHTIGITTVVP